MSVTSELYVDCIQFEKVVKNELKSYKKLAQFIENKIKNELIDEMINEYFNYINNIKCDNNIDITDSIKLIWKMHLLHPRTYRQDCFKRFGGILIPNDLELKLDSSSSISPPSSPLNVVKFTELNIKKSLFLHYEFIQKILSINNIDINIKKWISNYKQFMLLIGKSSDKDIIKPTIETDLIWHCHMLTPNIYIKESMILSNGKFVKHIIDLKQIKNENIKYENIICKNSMVKNNRYYGYMIIIMSLIFAIITPYVYMQHNDAEITHSIQYVTKALGVSCTTTDDMFCSYINGLHTIFTITDSLRDALNQSDFDSIRNDIINNANNKTIFYDEQSDTLLTSSSSRYPFDSTNKVRQLITNYGGEICEETNVNDQTPPNRINANSSCRGWIHIDNDNINIKQKPSLSITQQNGSYAILFGSIVDFDGDKLYYFYLHKLLYQNIGCTTDDAMVCGITNSQMILGNALFFISTLRYDYYSQQQLIWDTMNGNSYFQYNTLSYKYYVFVNGYNDGYQYVHLDANTLHTKTSINTVIRVGADIIYGEWIQYEASNQQQKRSYIIASYPDILGSHRLYVGSGYDIVTNATDSGSDAALIAAVTIAIIIGLCCLIVLFLWYYQTQSRTAAKSEHSSPDTSDVAMSTTINKSTTNESSEALKRRELLKLSKLELIKKCKQYGVATNGSKADIVNRLLSVNLSKAKPTPKPTPKPKPKQKQKAKPKQKQKQKPTPKPKPKPKPKPSYSSGGGGYSYGGGGGYTTRTSRRSGGGGGCGGGGG